MSEDLILERVKALVRLREALLVPDAVFEHRLRELLAEVAIDSYRAIEHSGWINGTRIDVLEARIRRRFGLAPKEGTT